MTLIASNISLILNLLFFVFIVFFAVLPYLIFLYWSRLYRKSTVSLSTQQIIHNFYLFLTCFTFGLTTAFLCIFSEYFYGATLVLLLLALVCAYLFYLQSTDVFRYIVISQQLPLLPLVITILVTLVALVYTGLLYLVHTKVWLTASTVALMGPALEAHLNSLDSPGSTDQAGGEIQVATPLEEGSASKKTGVIHNCGNWMLKKLVDNKVGAVIDAPTSAPVKELQREIFYHYSHSDSDVVRDPASLGVTMADNALVVKQVEIERGGGVENATAICFDTDKSASFLANASPPLLGGYQLQRLALASAGVHEQGCICVQGNSETGFNAVGGGYTVREDSLPDGSPRSPSNIDLQADRLGGKKIS